MSRRVPNLLTAVSILLLFNSLLARAEAPSAALAAFDTYVASVESRLAQEHGSAAGFLANVRPGSEAYGRVRGGELIIEKLSPKDNLQPKGALIHDWRGTAFIHGATAADFERLMKNFSAYPGLYAPQVTQARILAPPARPVPDHFTSMMRVRQKHLITVVMDSTYDVTYGRFDARHRYSISRSTKIDEIADAETPNEHALAANKEHGFLWRLNTYWSFEERDGGLVIQIESVSLSNGLPPGLGWAIGPYVESVPRDSLEFTLHSTTRALEKGSVLERGSE